MGVTRAVNLTPPASGVSRVLRGGSWDNDYADYFRCAYRNYCFSLTIASTAVAFVVPGVF